MKNKLLILGILILLVGFVSAVDPDDPKLSPAQGKPDAVEPQKPNSARVESPVEAPRVVRVVPSPTESRDVAEPVKTSIPARNEPGFKSVEPPATGELPDDNHGRSSYRPQPDRNAPPPGQEQNWRRGNDNRWRSGGGYRGGTHPTWQRWHFRGRWDFWSHPYPVFVPYPVVVHPPYVHRYELGVYVQTATQDPLGSDFVYALKEELRAVGLRPVYSQDEATLEIFVSSLDDYAENPRSASAVAVSYVWFPGNQFIGTQMQRIREYNLEDAAASVADFADELIHSYDD